MKKLILICVLSIGLLSVNAQISITADSMVVTKYDISSGKNIPVTRIKENMAIEIDKDLMTLRVLGKTEEMAYIEKAFILDFREVNSTRDKWLFQGSDKNFALCTITLDIPKKRVSFLTFGSENGIDKPLSEVYYTIKDVNINYMAIDKHLKEKGDRKF
jgi:hypothetical protein